MALIIKVFHQQYPLRVCLQTTGIEIKTRISKILDIAGVVIQPNAMKLFHGTEMMRDDETISHYCSESELHDKGSNVILTIEVDPNYSPRSSMIDNSTRFIVSGHSVIYLKGSSTQSKIRKGTWRRPKKYGILEPNVVIPQPTIEKKVLRIKDPLTFEDIDL